MDNCPLAGQRTDGGATPVISPIAPRAATCSSCRTSAPTGLVANRSVSTKILSVIGLLVLVVVGSGALAVTSLRTLAHQSAVLAGIQADVVVPLSGLHEAQLKARMIAAQVAAADTADAKKKWLADQVTNDGEIDGEIAAFEKATPTVFPGWTDFVSGWSAWKSARDTKLIPPALAGDLPGYQAALINVTEPLKDTYLNNLELVQGAVTTYSTGISATAAQESTSAIRTLVIALVAQGERRPTAAPPRPACRAGNGAGPPQRSGLPRS